MTLSADVYFSYRSPYSYLATPGMRKLGEDFDVDVAFRPVLPIAVRAPDFFSPENQKRARYIRMDWLRRAELLGMDRRWPSPDPIVQDMETYKIADEQPYIFRLTKLGVEAQRRGRGVDFAYEVSHLLFSGLRGWDQGDHLSGAAGRAGLDLADMERTIAAGEAAGDHMGEIERNQQMLEAANHWGVPTFAFRGVPFFGEDRIDTLRWRLEEEGLKRQS